MTTTISFCYSPKRYPLLHQWLESIPNGDKSHSIRVLLERSLQQGAGSGQLLQQILEEIRELRAMEGPIIGPIEHKDSQLDRDIEDNLRGLGK